MSINSKFSVKTAFAFKSWFINKFHIYWLLCFIDSRIYSINEIFYLHLECTFIITNYLFNLYNFGDKIIFFPPLQFERLFQYLYLAFYMPTCLISDLVQLIVFTDFFASIR